MTIIERLVAREASGWSIAWAILLIVLGAAAVAAPVVTSFAAVMVIAWFVIFGGFTHVLAAFGSTSVWSAMWTVLVGIAYLIAGVAIQTHPFWGLASLTLVISAAFAAQGVLAIAAYLIGPLPDRSVWTLFNGVVTLILSGMIWAGWPVSSMWVLGTLVGVNLMVTGASRLALSLTARRIQHVQQRV